MIDRIRFDQLMKEKNRINKEIDENIDAINNLMSQNPEYLRLKGNAKFLEEERFELGGVLRKELSEVLELPQEMTKQIRICDLCKLVDKTLPR